MRLFLKKRWVAVGSVVGSTLLLYELVLAPPTGFIPGTIFIVKGGEGVSEIAQKLTEKHLIAHPVVFRLLLRSVGAESTVQAGAYQFMNSENVLSVAYRLSQGVYGIPPARITLLEGMNVREFADRVAAALPEITAAEFISAGKEYEGYLFPDTYIFAPGADALDVVQTMRAQFDTKIQSFLTTITASGHSLSEVITMASLLEKEVRTDESRRMVAGILWHRLALGMPLQVDAVFGYIFDRPTYSPSFADLKVESPYNTYTHKGLPPTPINNPGLASIEAALHPIASPYLFYITGRDGIMHYASTYAQHLANQRKYLR